MRFIRESSMKMAWMLFLVVCTLSVSAFGQPWDGGGVEGDPYEIWTAEDMDAIGGSGYLGAHFKLMADIDLSVYTGTSFNNIGSFSGVFDGNGHTISNFTDNSALFGGVISQGTIRDLGLIDPNVIATAGGSTGSLAGSINERGATISGCYVEGGSITGYPAWYGNAGGLVGMNLRATITNCYSTAVVTGDEKVGGLVGESHQGTITDCHSTGQVQGQRFLGGLVGRNDGPITNCNSTASVSGNEDVGGLVGTNWMESGALIKGIITNCYSTGQVQGGSKVGGLVGSGSRIYNSYSVASVSGTTNVGGLVGSGGTIINSYSAGSVLGTTNVGGLLGNGGSITNSYSVGSVSGTTGVGGLVGIGGSDVYDSFWDIDVGGPDNGLGTPKATLEMKTQSTFTNAGWDFVGEYGNGINDDWAQGSGGGYMVLWWQLAEHELPPLPAFSGGAGTQSNPYLISNATDLNHIGNNGRLMAAHFKLINDIDLAGIDLFVIGSQWHYYSGVFDGNGYTISNFTYTSPGADRIGLFRWVDGPNAEIRDLGLIDPTIDAGLYVGSLAGVLQAKVSGCYVEGGSVSGGGLVGGLVGYKRGGTITNCDYSGSVSGGSGLVGYNSGTISNCSSDGSVSGGSGLVGDNSGPISNCHSTASLPGGGDYRGGLVGNNSGTITDCYATGSPSGHWNIGGLVGLHRNSTITNCYATGSASGSSATSGNEAIGGLVGYLKSGGIANCYSTGNVSGPGKDVGGLVGHSEGTINSSYSVSTVSSTSHRIGGLVGYHQSSTITNCYAWGSVSGSSSVGGLVGRNEGTIYYSYSVGSVSATGSPVGGLVGAGGLTFFSFWDTETSGQIISAGGIGLPTALMQTESTFTTVGWDFFYTWDILEGTNYPQLGWEVALSADMDMDEFWMYQSLPGQTNSNLIANVLITDDPWGNSSYTYEWEIVLPEDVTYAPTITAGGGFSDPCCTFAAPSCNEPDSISDSGQPLTVKVTITGNDYGNTGTAEAQFGIALLGDVNNDTAVNVADRSIINAFWRLGAAGPFTFTDCDINCDEAVNVADRSIANAVWRGVLGQNSVSNPCPFREVAPGMVLIPGDEFEMGDHFEPEGYDDELPVHAVLLDAFFMSKFEITNSQYCDYLNAAYPAQLKVVSGVVYAASDSGNSYPYCDTHNADTDSQIDFSDPDFSVRSKGGRDMSDDPMVEVSWYGAVAYCNWRSSAEGYESGYNLSTWECDFSKHGYRLPTEAEWEYAARGGLAGKRFPWSDPNISHSEANYDANPAYPYDENPTEGNHPDWNDWIYPYTSPVGTFSANGYGLYDMTGNVWEWCNDWYDENYYNTSPYDNPTGPTSGTYRVHRGGSWHYSAFNCRVAHRFNNYPILRYNYFGFRIVLDLN